MARFTLDAPFGRSAKGIGLVLAVAAAIALAFVALGALGFRFDPFDLSARKLARAQTETAQAKTDTAVATIEAAGARDTTTRVEIALAQSAAAQDLATHLSTLTRNAPDANEPLDPDRIDRLRDFDQQLCAVRPAICASAPDLAAAADPATDSATALPVGGSPTR